MGFFSKLFPPRNPDSYRYRRAAAERMNGLAIRYVTERHGDNDDVIGRDGNLSIHGDEFLVLSSGNIVLRADIAELRASELMSGDGVILTAPDREREGVERTITVHYVYHRR